MNIRITLIQRLCMLLMLVAAGFGLNACSDDAAAPAPAGSSTLTMFHANPAYNPDVVIRNDTATLAASLPYGTAATATVGNGSRSYSIRATDGTQLASTSLTLDSTVSGWVIFGGDANNKDAFTISTKKVTAIIGEAAIRVIDASRNAGDINLKINSLTGASFTTSSLSYKSASSYVTLTAGSIQKLIVLKPDNTTVLLEIPMVLSDTKSYTVIIYGSTDATVATYKLAAKVIAD